MGSWTITTTTAEDEAITYAHQQSQKPIMPISTPPPVETIEEYFQRMVTTTTVGFMVSTHQQAKNTELINTFATVPPENRDAAQADIESVVTAQGGTVKVREATYLWSDALTPPPPEKTVIADSAQSDWTLVTKLFFDDTDNNGVSQRAGLLAWTANTMIRIEDPRGPTTYFVVFIMTGSPVGQTGYVEVPVRYHQSTAPLGAGWPMTCKFS